MRERAAVGLPAPSAGTAAVLRARERCEELVGEDDGGPEPPPQAAARQV